MLRAGLCAYRITIAASPLFLVRRLRTSLPLSTVLHLNVTSAPRSRRTLRPQRPCVTQDSVPCRRPAVASWKYGIDNRTLGESPVLILECYYRDALSKQEATGTRASLIRYPNDKIEGKTCENGWIGGNVRRCKHKWRCGGLRSLDYRHL
jgi:hypothetical protein